MGADGHIIIYDYDKLVELMGHEPVTSATTYIHHFQNKKVLTRYFGDNVYTYQCFVCGKDTEDDEAHPRRQDNEYLREDCEEKFDEARIGEWEVWT